MNKRIILGLTLGMALLAGYLLASSPFLLRPTWAAKVKSTRPARVRTLQTPLTIKGQSATLLSDGRWLLLGGAGANGSLATAFIKEAGSADAMPLASTLRAARAYHTATLLPDGRVLIFGGVAANARVVGDVELFDPQSQTFTPLTNTGLSPRAEHTATLLTDGRVLFIGGRTADGSTSNTVEVWETATNVGASLLVTTLSARRNHVATLLADGSVQIWGGTDAFGKELNNGEQYDPVMDNFNWLNTPISQDTKAAPFLVASLPSDGASEISVTARFAMRFSQLLDVSTLTAEAVSLRRGSTDVAVQVVQAENGRLAFVKPIEPLSPATAYTLSVEGATDTSGRALQFLTVTFTTARVLPGDGHGSHDQPSGHQHPDDTTPPHDVQQSPEITRSNATEPADPEEWIPDADNLRGDWRSKRPHAARADKPLQAEAGVTALSGQVLTLTDAPLPNVTVQIGSTVARTDQTGRFLLTGLPPGRQVLLINGNTASSPNKPYASFEVSVEMAPNRTNVLPYTIWLPLIDTRNATELEVPTQRAMRATTERIPGLEVRVPAGVQLRFPSGRLMDSLTITAIPSDRPPYPGPDAAPYGYMFTLQMHGARVEPVVGAVQRGLRIVFPNLVGAAPGTRLNLWNYETSKGGWYVYGQGIVTADGTRVAPEEGVELQSMHCNFFLGGPGGPSTGGAPGSSSTDGDPVDLGTGLFVYNKTDLVLPDTIPVKLSRTYRQNDSADRTFGKGASHPYAIYLLNPYPNSYNTDNAVLLPDGSQIKYTRNTSGVLEHTATPTAFFRSTLTQPNTDKWELKLLNGTIYGFYRKVVSYSQFSHSTWVGLEYIQDRYGNRLRVTSDDLNRVTQVTSPNGRWLAFTYDGLTVRITQAKDSTGRTITYQYDAGGRLWKMTDAKGGVTEYLYDSAHRMLSIKDARGIVFLTNEYDTNGRVRKQTQADTGTYQFAYTLDGAGKVTQTDVTDPRGHVRRVTFNSAGYPLTDIFALGTAEQQTYTYARQTGTNAILSVTDPLGRQTALAYDEMSNVTSVTRLAGTPEAVSATITYEPTYNEVATVTDPLNHTASFAYDSSGKLTSVTDPLNHQTSFTYNSAGQVLTATDPLERTIQFTYDSGDLVSITDPLNRTVKRYIDSAGRLTGITNPLGDVTRYEYDNLNQPARGTNPLQGETAFAYDPNGNLLSVTDARNSVTSYIYDNKNRVITRRDPLLHDETYQYDLNDNISRVTDRKGQITNFTYDALDRLTQVTNADTSTTTYTYDSVNRLTQVVDSLSGTITYGYDTLDRLTSENTPQGSVGYAYDAVGRRTSMTAAGQPTVNYTYDNADRLTQITQGSSIVTIAYDDAGRRTSLTLPNGIVTEYAYDLASHLTSLTYKRDGNVIGDLTYEYDANGKRTRMGGSFARNLTPPTLASASYNAANQQLAFGSQTLTYDLNGNLLGDGQNSYTWDARNRLVAIDGPGVSANFQYDAAGGRSSKTINAATTSFLYDGANVVQEQSSQTGNANILSGGIDEIFTRSDSSGAFSPLADGLGSSLSLTDASGAVQTEYAYGSFGQAATSGASSNNSSQYTGRENDGTDLQYNRARYYSPALQRFISEDPIGFAGGDNIYAYVGNDPISFTDPSGLQSGPTNYLRDPFSADNWIANAASNTISDMLNLDGFAEWSWVAGDHCRPASERLWAGAKIIGGVALVAGGGPIGRGVGRGVKLLRGGAADVAGAAPKLLGTARDNLLEAATDPRLRDAINNLYRKGATIGNGSSMDALRREGTHLIKVLGRRRQLLKIRPDALLNPKDRQLIKEILIDMQDALGSHLGP